jgi:outer membrane lipoprotein-sorting protein
MVLRRVPATILAVCLASFALSSCFARRRTINRPGGKVTQTLLVADRDTLLQAIARQYNAVRDFSATVDMTPALGTAEKSRITEYKEVRGYIRFRKPGDIRIIGLVPVVRNKAWDMVSNGTDFKLYLPVRNLFLVGRNQVEKPSANKIENLRPQHFLDAMLVRPINPDTEKILLENYTDEDNAYYILHVVHLNGGGQLQLSRTIWFDRLTLQLARQLIFDESGNILTDARYAQWKAWDNVPFPKHVEINRPGDEYAVVMEMLKLDINKGVSEDQFVLEQPEGTTLQTVGQAPAPAPAPAQSKPKPATPSQGRKK